MRIATGQHFPELAALDFVTPEIALPLRQRFYPLGFPLDVETNSYDVLNAAAEAWKLFPQAFEEAAVRVSLTVVEGDEVPEQAEPRFFWREHLMSISDGAQNFVVCDFYRGFACGVVTRAAAMDHSSIRYRFLTPVAHTLIEQRRLAPVHGALVVRNGHGVMLTGVSLAGKSTLAYALSRAGWTYVSDDAIFLVRGNHERLAIGNPHFIRFREDARRLFPELENHPTVVRPNGKPAIEVMTRDLPISVAPRCTIDHVVFLARRQSGGVSLTHYPKDRALESWQAHIVLGTTNIRAAQLDCQRRLAEATIWELQYAMLDDAVARLEQLADCGA